MIFESRLTPSPPVLLVLCSAWYVSATRALRGRLTGMRLQASVASQIILHPALTATLKVASTTGKRFPSSCTRSGLLRRDPPRARAKRSGIPGRRIGADAFVPVGRDKVYRTVQYFARFLAFYCLRKGYSNELVARLQALKSALGMSRKCAYFPLRVYYLNQHTHGSAA